MPATYPARPRPAGSQDRRSAPATAWLYVLVGRLRLVLGERDLALRPGEVAEFDARTPHWFGSDGRHEAEILSILDPHGERADTCVETH